MIFEANPKITRLYRDIVVTEKIDGTHGALFIDTEDGTFQAASRNRFVLPGKSTDNFGFATWAYEHRDALTELLGHGIHRGEWFGIGIQRNYINKSLGTPKQFALFNTSRWSAADIAGLTATNGSPLIPRLTVVPVLYEGCFSQNAIEDEMFALATKGSALVPGFMDPEGLVIYHTHSRQSFKWTLGGDGHKRDA